MLIDRTDFVGRINVGRNVPDADINVCINMVQEYVFKPLIDANLYAALITLTSGSTESQKKTFWTERVKPFLVYAFAKEFLILHGRNITQFGINVVADDASTPISDSARTEMIAIFERNYNIELNLLKAELDSKKYTFDGVVYLEGDLISEVKPRRIIRPIQ